MSAPTAMRPAANALTYLCMTRRKSVGGAPVPLHRRGDPPAVTKGLDDTWFLPADGTSGNRVADRAVALSTALGALQRREHGQVTARSRHTSFLANEKAPCQL